MRGRWGNEYCSCRNRFVALPKIAQRTKRILISTASVLSKLNAAKRLGTVKTPSRWPCLLLSSPMHSDTCNGWTSGEYQILNIPISGCFGFMAIGFWDRSRCELCASARCFYREESLSFQLIIRTRVWFALVWSSPLIPFLCSADLEFPETGNC